MKKLTDRQKEIFTYIVNYMVNNHGRPPSSVEIGKEFDMSASAALQHIDALCKKGYTDKEKGKVLSLHLTDKGKKLGKRVVDK